MNFRMKLRHDRVNRDWETQRWAQSTAPFIVLLVVKTCRIVKAILVTLSWLLQSTILVCVLLDRF
jgi:hypothetical protein